MLSQHGFDLSRFDAVAVTIDLSIRAAQQQQRAVRQLPREIARPVRALSVAESHEPLSGRRVVADIAARERDAGDVHLAGNAWWHGAALRIDKINVGVRYGTPEGQRRRTGQPSRIDGVCHHADRRLSRAVVIEETAGGVQPAEPLDQSDGG